VCSSVPFLRAAGARKGLRRGLHGGLRRGLRPGLEPSVCGERAGRGAVRGSVASADSLGWFLVPASIVRRVANCGGVVASSRRLTRRDGDGPEQAHRRPGVEPSWRGRTHHLNPLVPVPVPWCGTSPTRSGHSRHQQLADAVRAAVEAGHRGRRPECRRHLARLPFRSPVSAVWAGVACLRRAGRCGGR
jgi:hypothetical protein